MCRAADVPHLPDVAHRCGGQLALAMQYIRHASTHTDQLQRPHNVRTTHNLPILISHVTL
jgi:hypothetical protein